MNNKNNYCPICGSKDIELQITSETFEYKGQELTIDKCVSLLCHDCRESIFTKGTSERVEGLVRDFHKQITEEREGLAVSRGR